ncbi:MAG: sigma-54-dependent Fis family transcriptional regulator [Labilithrix sp.]|nr:sigma-54-dependent Fis family transcriptional regulator [Labilithrix sp.]MCW5815339.1 sigma-54-dependent Fis family transcriptional regulator [Labilithrix sp.]
MPFRPHLAGARPAPALAAPVEIDGGAVQFDDDPVVGAATGLRSVIERIEQVAPTEAPVLLEGETGSGKELIARVLHVRSRRARGPMIRVNCGAIPKDLVDSELFGHERGSFTGATSSRQGWFERADGGTLFLDEIAELPLAAQVRLLRVLQEGTLQRVGGSKTLEVSVRIVTATHRDLRAMCAAGAFREDLWYRIGVFAVRIPPLRDRPYDIPALAAHFARRSGLRLTGVPLVPTEAEIAALQRYTWPGNVRELAAVVERAAILGGGLRLDLAGALGDPLPAIESSVVSVAPRADAFPTLADAMRAHIGKALERTRGRIEGPAGAAALLGLNPHTLRGKMRKLAIDWARYR